MSNPAWQLHAMYNDLRTRAETGTSLSALLELDGQAGHRWWMTAASLLGRIERLLEALRQEGHRVDVYQRQTKNWLSPLTGRQTGGWNTVIVSDQVISQDHLDQIEALASFLDGKIRELDEPNKESLRDIVERASKLLAVDDSLPSYLKIYLHRLIQEVSNALQDEAAGLAFDFDDATTRLAVALSAAGAQSKSKRDAWMSLIRDMTTGVGSGLLVEGFNATLRALGAG